MKKILLNSILTATLSACIGWSNVANAQTLFKDLVPGANQGSQPKDFITVNGTMYFITIINGSSSYLHRLWKSDGTPTGTVVVKDSIINTNVLGVMSLFDVNGTLFYTLAKNGSATSATIFEIWKSDGTTAGTVRIDSLTCSAGGTPQNWIVAGDKLFFSKGSVANPFDRELWVCDGTPGSTQMVVDLNPGTIGGLSNQPMGAYNGKVYFQGSESSNFGAPINFELYSSDGTIAGTTLVKDINPGASSSEPGSWVLYNSELYFSAQDETGMGRGLWKTDGTMAGTELVFSNANDFNSKVVCNNLLFVVNGIDLWKSDGTTAGTVFVMDSANVINGATSTYLFTQYMKSLSVAPYFEMLYKKTDGTTSSTISYDHGNSASYVLLDDKMYQRGQNYPVAGISGLWVNDGTEAGTSLLFNAPYMGLPYVFNSTIFFSNFSSAEGYELWSYTPVSTGLSAVQNPQAEISIYPNPSTGVFQLNISNIPSVNTTVEIYSTTGEKVYGGTIIKQQSEIDISNLSNGIYFVRINDQTKVYSTKIIVQ